MIEYLYFVKWLDNNNIAEEVFEFFDEAKSFAMNILSQQPEIHQTEIIRNDFGECIDSNEIGKVWSWEELMDDIPENTETDGDFHIFTRCDFDKYADGYDPDNDPEFDDRDITFETDCVTSTLDELPDNFCNPIKSKQDGLTESSANNKFIIVGEKEDYSKQFYNMESSEWVSKSYDATLFDDRNSAIEVLYDLDKSDFYTIRVMIKPVSVNEGISDNFRKPIPEGKTIKDLVEEMEENEDMVECKWCDELFDKSDCRYEVDMGWLCPQCIEAIKSRGEELTFRENVQEAAASKKATNNIYDVFNDGISLYYDGLEATVCYDQRDADWWSEKEYVSDEFEYEITFEDFADLVCDLDNADYNKFITQYPEALEDENFHTTSELWVKFVKDNAEELMAKHNEYIFEFYKDDARDAFEEWAYNDFNEHRYDGPDPDEERDRYLDRYGWD